MQPHNVPFISALTALVASILGPVVTLSVARRQFSANVVSANRQRWIDSFRERLAELLSMITTVQVTKRALIAEWRGGDGAMQADPALREKLQKTTMALAHIRLLTNTEDGLHDQLNDAVSRALEHLRSDELREERLSTEVDDITRIGRVVIRQEWARVKRGI